jgi:hypothetical protein
VPDLEYGGFSEVVGAVRINIALLRYSGFPQSNELANPIVEVNLPRKASLGGLICGLGTKLEA